MRTKRQELDDEFRKVDFRVIDDIEDFITILIVNAKKEGIKEKCCYNKLKEVRKELKTALERYRK